MSCTNCDPQPCDCPIKDLGTDCSVYNQDENLDQLGAPKGTILSIILQNINKAFKDLKESLGTYFQVVNVGTGAKIYSGVNGLGVKLFRSILQGANIIVTENSEDIELAVPDSAEDTKGAIAIATQVEADAGTEPYKAITPLTLQGALVAIGVPDGSETIVNQGTNVTITGTGTSGDPYIINATPADGSETVVTEGTNITITGTGTSGDPYVINAAAGAVPDGSETIINQGTNITITGTGTSGDPYVINSTDTIADGSETAIANSTTTDISGDGTLGTPYEVEVKNLQRTVTASFTLLDSDNGHTIIIDNAAAAVVITVPTGLRDSFNCSFIQQGTGEVSFLASGTTLNSALGLKIEGANYWAYIEKAGAGIVFQLLGMLKA